MLMIIGFAIIFIIGYKRFNSHYRYTEEVPIWMSLGSLIGVLLFLAGAADLVWESLK